MHIQKCASIHPVNWQAPAIEVTAQPATNGQYIHNSQFKEFEIHLLNTDPKQLEMATKHAERAHERPAYENELKKREIVGAEQPKKKMTKKTHYPTNILTLCS